ncbi:MAG: hypothetical protein RRY34_10940, partial [Victivallaceae bacterium]
MKPYLQDKNIRLRCKKEYPGAHTHILIGTVVAENANYLALKGRTFHYNRIVDQLRSQIFCGDVMIRVVPWSNIEIIHELGPMVDYQQDIAFDSQGNLILADEKRTMIA